jgi:uridine kinase
MGKKVAATTIPGAPIVSSALVQLRGTSGSGKTTAMHAFMKSIGAKPIEMNDRMTKNTVYRGRIDLAEDKYVHAYVLGDYSPHRSAGGCDTIPSVQQVIDLVEKYGSRRGSVVVFEGLLLAHSWGALGEYVHPRWGKRYVNAFLDTPVETCIERVTARRAAKGRGTEGDRAEKIEKNIRDDYYRVELCHKRVIDRGGVLVDIRHKRAKIEFTNLVMETAAKFCI